MEWTSVRNADLSTPITGMPNSACARAPSRAAARVEVGVTVDYLQPSLLMS